MTSAESSHGGCPVVDYIFIEPPAPALSFFGQMDELRAFARPAVWSEEAGGYWIFTDHATILDGLQHPELFSSQVIVPTDRNPAYKWLPIMLDPPEHGKWRHVLASYFSPGRVRGMQVEHRAKAAALIDGFRSAGECDFVNDFAQLFPAAIFLQIMGMPAGELTQFMQWEHMILRSSADTEDPNAVQTQGMMAVMSYFNALIAERRANPVEGADDIVSDALNWTIDGAPAPDSDVLNCLLLLFMAGLDTVAGQLSYMLLHLATHPEDRRRIVEDPSLIPHVVEELLRLYPIVQTARKVALDSDFRGCPVKAGDMVVFPLSASGRDEDAFPDALRLDFEREDTRHISFGAGPHRCLGSHLARQELVVALEQWHAHIPEYEVVGEPTEHKGGVYGLEELHLRWAL